MADAALDMRAFDPLKVKDLIDELSERNHVRVVKYEARKRDFSRRIMAKVSDEMGVSQATIPSLVLHDSLRMLSGKKPIYFAEALKRIGGDLRSITPNLRTTIGADFAAAQLGGTTVLMADWIALTNNTNSPASGDTSATVQWATGTATDVAASGTSQEYTALGVGRKLATYAHTASTAVYTQAATWTATGTVTSLRMAGLFGGAGKTAQGSGGTNILFLENTFTATSLVNNDQLSLTWTVNI
jgi:hypothetical protein